MSVQNEAMPAPFRAVLYPNASLDRSGAIIVLLATAALCGASGCVFAIVGAWPVSGFLGLDVLLLAWAFRVARRRTRRSEEILLDRSGLHVRHVAPDGTTHTVRLEPYWVRVQLDEAGPARAALWLRSHGWRLRVGAFLSAEECRGLAHALERALAPYR